MANSKKEYSKRFFYMQIYLMIFLSIAPMNRSSSIFNEIKAKKKGYITPIRIYRVYLYKSLNMAQKSNDC